MNEMVSAIIIENKRILLVHNIKHNHERIETPGGKREENETLEGCAIRETEEELGINIEPIELFGSYEVVSPEGEFTVHMFLCKIRLIFGFCATKL